MVPQYIDIVLRSAVTFVALVLVSRGIGKKYDILTGFAIGGIATAMSVDPNLRIVNGLIALAVWVILSIALGLVSLKSMAFRQFVLGKPNVLIEQGQVLEKNLKKSRMTIDEMMALLREKSAFKVADVEFGVLEADGQLSVMKKSGLEPLTPVLQGIPVEAEQAPRVVLVDGQVLEKPLQETGYSAGWLLGQIRQQGATDYSDVFLAQLDSKGNVYVDLKSDLIQPQQIKARPLLLASLKKIQADLEIFALETVDVDTKQMYTEQSQRLTSVIEQMQYYLRQ